MSPRRWKDGYDPLAHTDAAAFLALRRYLAESDAQPDSCLLENVAAALKHSRAQVPTAAELIMAGIEKKPGGKKGFQIRLEVLEGVLGENVWAFEWKDCRAQLREAPDVLAPAPQVAVH